VCPVSVAVGTYLTNGVFLYRVASLAASGGDMMVELEDCFGLDVVSVPIEDPRIGSLRVLTPASTSTGARQPGGHGIAGEPISHS
jgi:hypothetical protein